MNLEDPWNNENKNMQLCIFAGTPFTWNVSEVYVFLSFSGIFPCSIRMTIGQEDLDIDKAWFDYYVSDLGTETTVLIIFCLNQIFLALVIG